MIFVQNVSKRYKSHHGAHWVLKDVSIVFPPRVSVGLIGQNGAGKSTLLNLIAGQDSPDRGEIVRKSRVSWPIGLSGSFQPSMTGRENVKFVARVHCDESEVRSIVDFVLEFSELGDAFDDPVRTYSSGMNSRLAFGLSLAIEFDVYLSDEATAVGDARFQAKASAAFKERVDRASLIIVSHEEGILRDLCQAGVWVHGGKAVWFDDVAEALSAYRENKIEVFDGV